MSCQIVPIQPKDEPLVEGLLKEHWGARQTVTRGRVIDAATLPGFIAYEGEVVVGLATLLFSDDQCELVTLDAFVPSKGVGSALFADVAKLAQARACRRLWLITTNDNINALAFYQKRGMHIVAVYPDAVTAAREIKPQIPLIAENGIAIRDEIELEMVL